MDDIIHLLPDNIANQIAAGEVIQRPASAVKELLENAIDAGADEIRLLISDSGKSLIQVTDNGRGMSESDARMAFERHATSKIRDINDLFHIKTMGFRGEALASIAAVSQVELKTKRSMDPTGTLIEIDNSVVRRQEPVALSGGSSIAMKNLFFNVPARRNFLKSNASELRHIVDEFTRVALAFPGIFFSFVSNGQEVFHLEKGTLKQRIIQLLGNHYTSRLVSVQEKTDYLDIHGFVGKPEAAKKTRGDQYFFVNNRFIKSPYLHHAVMHAFDQMILPDSFPMYALFIDINPELLDVNVHPTKQEIKFEDEKIVYAFVQSAVKHALAQFSITPTLDFELDANIEKLDAVSKPVTGEHISEASRSSLYQAFTQKNQAHFIEKKSDLRHWRDLYEKPVEKETGQIHPSEESVYQKNSFKSLLAADSIEDKNMVQLHGSYILIETSGGFLLVHQQNAHERIIYDRLQVAMNGKEIPTQQSLFPVMLELSPSDALVLSELSPDLKKFGFQIEPFGSNTFAIQGTPAHVAAGNERVSIEQMLEQFKHFSNDIRFSRNEKLLRSLCTQQSVKSGTALSLKEMQEIATQLFSSSSANVSPSGKPTYTLFNKQELDKMFSR